MATLVKRAPRLPVPLASSRMRLKDYDHDIFHSLRSIAMARAHFKSIGAERLIGSEFKNLFCEYKMDRTYGLMLLHRHFNINSDERLVEYGGTTVPWQKHELYQGVSATTWLVCSDGTTSPI